jgi:hypothetical protein
MLDFSREAFEEIVQHPERNPVSARRFLQQCLEDLSQFENTPLTPDFINYLEFKAEVRYSFAKTLNELDRKYGRSA